MKNKHEVWDVATHICKCPWCGELTKIECFKYYHEQCDNCTGTFLTENYSHFPYERYENSQIIKKNDICTFLNFICNCPNCGKLTQVDYKIDYIEKCEYCKKRFET